MALKKKKNLVFQTKKERKSGQLKRFILALVVFVAVCGSLSVIYLMKNYNFDLGKALGERETTVDATADTLTCAPTEQSSSTYLFFSADSEKSRLNFAVAVRFSVPDCTVEICPIDPEAAVTYGGEASTLVRTYSAGGVKALVEACSSVCGAKIDRYVGSTDEAFRQTVYSEGYAGGFKVNVREQIEHRGSDFNLILTKGNQSLKGDTLLKYLRYLYSVKPGGSQELAEAFQSILTQVFASESADAAPAIFRRLVNTLDTDVTQFDFSAASAGLGLFFEGDAQYSCCQTLG